MFASHHARWYARGLIAMTDARAVNDYWGRDNLGQTILDALAAAGKNLDRLTVDDLAASDQFHSGGKPATARLARLAGLSPRTRVLDVGGGLGGPARTLAAEFGCRVTVIDPTESYVLAATMLTERLRLGDRVSHRLGDALDLPFEDGAFDVVWTQNSGMNIADKDRLYAGLRRVLRLGGLLAFQEPMAGAIEPPIFPLMWAREPAQSFLRAPAEMRASIERAGFRLCAWDDVTRETAGPPAAATVPPHSVQRLIMGDALEAIRRAGQRNREEGRIVMVQAVFEGV
jgi:ubiquinone/menaquinone biosynthesis C-methylase UbiE